MSRGGDWSRARARASAGALVAVAAVTLGAVALVHPLQYLGFHARGALWTAAPVPAAVGFALAAAAGLWAPAFGLAGTGASAPAGRTRAPRWALPALAAAVAWPVFAAVFVPAALIFGAPARRLAALPALALAGALVARPAWRAKPAVGIPLTAGAAALLAVSLGLAGAVASLVLLALLGGVAARSDSDGDRVENGPDPTPTSGSDRERGDRASAARAPSLGPAGLVGPALLAAAAGFWAPAPSLGVPFLALNPLVVGSAIGAAAGVIARAGLISRGSTLGPVLPSGGALAGYLAGALWTGVSLSGALGG